MAANGLTTQLGVASGEESPTSVPAGALGPDGAEREHAEQQAAADDGDLRPVTLGAGKDATGAERTDDDGSQEHRYPPADQARVAPPAAQPRRRPPCHRRLSDQDAAVAEGPAVAAEWAGRRAGRVAAGWG